MKLLIFSDTHGSAAPLRAVTRRERPDLVAVHGHRNGVRQGLLPLHYLAQELGARLVCFGHTHCPTLVEEDGVTFLNPGACSGMHPTYAVAELSDGHIQHIEIKSVEETT